MFPNYTLFAVAHTELLLEVFPELCSWKYDSMFFLQGLKEVRNLQRGLTFLYYLLDNCCCSSFDLLKRCPLKSYSASLYSLPVLSASGFSHPIQRPLETFAQLSVWCESSSFQLVDFVSDNDLFFLYIQCLLAPLRLALRQLELLLENRSIILFF